MKLMQLKMFVAACQYGNITRAAEALHISQPSVTNAIKELEAEFGVALLHRLSRGFHLTEEGELLLRGASQLLKDADEISRAMHERGRRRKIINLGIPPMIGTAIFPKLYKGFTRAFPEIQLSTLEAGSRQLLEALDNRLDLAILPINLLSNEEYHILPFGSVETVFCVSEKHHLAGRRNVTIEDIKDEPLIMFDIGFFHNMLLEQRYQQCNIPMPVIHRSGQLRTIAQFIADGIACGFMFRDVAEQTPGIKAISLDEPLMIQLGIVRKWGQPVFNSIIEFIQYVKRADWTM